MSRLSKLARMTIEEKTQAFERFEQASSESLFPPEIIALVFNVSESWLQKMRSLGGGIPFSKPNGINRVQYQKHDVVNYFTENKRQSTSAA